LHGFEKNLNYIKVINEFVVKAFGKILMRDYLEK